MKIKTIMAKQAQQNVKFDTARAIRALLDEARKVYGAEDWDGDDVEAQISDLVFGED